MECNSSPNSQSSNRCTFILFVYSVCTATFWMLYWYNIWNTDTDVILHKQSASLSLCCQAAGESGVNTAQTRGCWICMNVGQCVRVLACNCRACQAAFLIRPTCQSCTVWQSAAFHPPPTLLRSQGLLLYTAVLKAPFCSLKLATYGCFWFVWVKGKLSLFCSPVGKFVQKSSALSVFGILPEKTLQFRLVLEGAHQVFSNRLSAVSSWNRAACVGLNSYLHIRIWNLNDTNIIAFCWETLTVLREGSFSTFDSSTALFSNRMLTV